jgi:hypothetical protein
LCHKPIGEMTKEPKAHSGPVPESRPPNRRVRSRQTRWPSGRAGASAGIAPGLQRTAGCPGGASWGGRCRSCSWKFIPDAGSTSSLLSTPSAGRPAHEGSGRPPKPSARFRKPAGAGPNRRGNGGRVLRSAGALCGIIDTDRNPGCDGGWTMSLVLVAPAERGNVALQGPS